MIKQSSQFFTEEMIYNVYLKTLSSKLTKIYFEIDLKGVELLK